MKKGNEGERYLEQYPPFKKWINQCVVCQIKGIKASMPDEQVGHKNLKKFFMVLELDDLGRCSSCGSKAGNVL